MVKLPPKSRFLFVKTCFYLSFLIIFANEVAAQKKQDYVVISDSIFSHGYIQELPLFPKTDIQFKFRKKEPFKTYRIEEISEFRLDKMLFQRKQVSLQGEPKTVFLELLSDSVKNASIWKLNMEVNKYFIITPDGPEELTKENYKALLLKIFENEELEPLLEISNLKDWPLEYVSKTVNTWQGPRTFTKAVRVSPMFGFASLQNKFIIPDTNVPFKFSSYSPTIGANVEVFLNFLRNVSFNIGGTWNAVDDQITKTYVYGSSLEDSDFFLDYNLYRFPLSGRYYLDLNPNKFRVFGQAGYELGVLSMDNSGMYVASRKLSTIVTQEKPLPISSNYSGIKLGAGVEKYFRNHQAILASLQFSNLQSDVEDSITALEFLVGYKF